MAGLFKNKIKLYFCLIVLSSVYFFSGGKVYSAGPVVWLEDGMTRIFKNDPAKNANSITLYSAKNEYEPFQIVVKAPSGNGLTNVNVSVSNLTGANGSVITASNLIFYREHYLNVTAGSRHQNGETNVPLGPGLYPDALIPFKNPANGADLTGQLDAVPFNLSAGENQPVWVDIFIPSDAKEGLYQGTVTVTSTEGNVSLNFNLNVWNFVLPKIRSLKGQTHIWSAGYKNRNTDIELLKHRFNSKQISISDERFLIDNYAQDEINIFTASGATLNNCTARPPPLVSDVAAEVTRHQQDVALFNSYANEVWNCTSQFPVFMQWAANLRAGGIKPEIVTYPVDALMGTDLNHTAGDIWYFLPKHYDLAKTNINKLINHQGTEVRSYNPLVQDGFSPKYTIDFSPINARIMQGFINQSLGLTGTKFWRVDNWTTDPWNNPNLLSQGGQPVPGEGAMVYPGDKVGLPGLVVSGVRMKWFREGSEDYEYIQLLENQGQNQFVADTVKTVATDFKVWSKDKNVLLSARKTLGDKLAGSPGNITPTLTPTPTGNRTPTPSTTLRASPTPTGSATAAKLKFKVILPDISSTVNNLASSQVQVEAKDGTSSVTTANVGLTKNGNYFQTSPEVSLNITQNKSYTILIKTSLTVRKSFASVNLTSSQTLDCTVSSNTACGELISQRDTKTLLSGDTDGFNSQSGSFNKVDSADLQVLASQFNSQPPSTGQSSDFNLDSQVNISDLEILGRNYGSAGE